MTELTIKAGPQERALPFTFDSRGAYEGYARYDLDDPQARALRETEVPMLADLMAGSTLLMSAHESILLLAAVAMHFRALDRAPKGVSKDMRKEWRARLLRREELRQAMERVWDLPRVKHALRVTETALEPEQVIEYLAHGTEPDGYEAGECAVEMLRPRTDGRACGKARRALAREDAQLRRCKPSPSQARALKEFVESEGTQAPEEVQA